MKEKMIFGMLALFLVALAGVPVLHAMDEERVEVSDQALEEASDPSEFEGDSEDMPGERAPENMPMDDVPVDAGMGVEI
jgi:hypothetical protein